MRITLAENLAMNGSRCCAGIMKPNRRNLRKKFFALKKIEVQETQIQNIETFIQKASQYIGIEELTSYALHELIKAIYVYAPDKSSGKRRQHIHIQYDGLGFIPLNELLAQEKA